MNEDRPLRPDRPDPGACSHRRVGRIGIQRSPLAPHRLHLVTCEDCGTTLSTETLRRMRREAERMAG